ncbi:hypothetical protein NUW58_g6888 [Xylaria curta]|uniref:Uncharacterized protein n=1 Tax=Xylaria curta TaxID=42375 RepID=A0ACC1NMV3_9PEZI|nr:hypothetical protein NUW58_g6888 [Xylaria curta]
MRSSTILSPSCGPWKGQLQYRAPSDSLRPVHCDAMGTPFEEIVRSALRSQAHRYYIKPSSLDEGDLVVFPAISYDGALCEAQCFKKCELPRKLYLSRKRRIQRLQRSSNLMHELDEKDVKILVSRVPKNNAPIGSAMKNSYAYSTEKFPPLHYNDAGGTPDGSKLAKEVGEHSYAKVAAAFVG